MSREIRFMAARSYGDCTTRFVVEGVDGMKVSEFIGHILKTRPEDSGTFSIDGVKFPYDNKRRKLSINTDEAPCHLTIASVTAFGAYWQMDYGIITKNTTKPIMSRETTFKKGAFVGGYEYSSAERLSEDIAKKEADVNYYKQKLLAMACATPIDVTPAGQDPLEHVKYSFDEVFDELQEQLFQLHTLYVVQLNEENIDNGEDE